MWDDTEVSKENIGPSSVSTSVGEILQSLARVYPAANEYQIGESLMQATLSPQAAADLLFYLTKPMSTASASMTTPSMETICFSIEEVLIRYGAGTADALEERYRDAHFKGITTKEWTKREYEAKIVEIKEKLAALY